MKPRINIVISCLLLLACRSMQAQDDTLRFESYKAFTDYVTENYRTKYPDVDFFKHKIVGTPTNPYDRFRGDTLDSLNTTITYLSLINELDISNFQSHPKINMQYVMDRMLEGAANNLVPISVALVRYSDFKDSALVLGSLNWNNTQYTDNGPDGFYPFEHKILFASSSLNQAFDHPDITFTFDESLFLSNLDFSVASSIEIDYGNQEGFEPLRPNQSRTVNYISSGEKLIRVRLVYNGRVLVSGFKIIIQEQDTSGQRINGPNSVSSCVTPPTLPNAGPYFISTTKLGSLVTGRYAVWYSTCNSARKIRKPFIISAGFNPGNGKQLVSNGLPNFLNFVINNITISLPLGGWNGDWRGLYYETYNGGYNKRFSPTEASQCNEGSSNGDRYLDRLRDEGYDVIILMYDDGTDYAIHNAALFMELIEQINAIKFANGYYFENVVSGYSAGGIASKLALSLMESRYKQGIGPHPHTKLWVSVETENQGANVPLGLQHFFAFQKNPGYSMPLVAGINFLQVGADAINQVVANLSYNYNNNPCANELTRYMASAGNGKHPDRINLENTFASIPGNTSNGYPEFCRRVGVGQGSGLGYNIPHTQPEILDTRLKFDIGGSFTATSFPSGCGGSYTWYLPSAEKHTTARWWGSINGSNIFDGRVVMDSRTTLVPMMCVKLPWWLGGSCSCTGPFTVGSYVVIGDKHVSKPTSTTNYDDVPSSTQSAHIEAYSQSAYPFYNNWFAGTAFAHRDQNLHGFAPTVSTLDLHDPNTGAPLNNFTSPNSLNLFKINPANTEPDLRFGFPYITYPGNHYVVTPYDAVFAIGNNNGTYSDGVTPKPRNQFHVEDPQSMMGDYLARTEVAPENLFLSNQTVGQTAYTYSGYSGGYTAEFEARSKIIAGKTDLSNNNIYSLYGNSNYLTPIGDFKVSINGKAILHSGDQVELLPGVSIDPGAELAAYIQPYNCGNFLFRENEIVTDGNTLSNGGTSENNSSMNTTAIKTIPEKTKGLHLYPNPNNGIFTIVNNADEPETELLIFDATGRTAKALIIANNQDNELNLQDLDNGIYLIMVKKDSGHEKFKLMISK